LARLNYALAFVGAAVTYGMMVIDAGHTRDWIHVVTLTPLFPYLVAAGLAYRHRHRRGRSALVTGLIVFSAAVGWPLFWLYYLPANVAPQTKVLTKIVLPVCQGLFVVVFGVLMEVTRRDQTHRPEVPSY